VEADRELILEDARSIGRGLWRRAHLAQDAAEALDARVENEDLDAWRRPLRYVRLSSACKLSALR
jgi:hypothetical protein